MEASNEFLNCAIPIWNRLECSAAFSRPLLVAAVWADLASVCLLSSRQTPKIARFDLSFGALRPVSSNLTLVLARIGAARWN